MSRRVWELGAYWVRAATLPGQVLATRIEREEMKGHSAWPRMRAWMTRTCVRSPACHLAVSPALLLASGIHMSMSLMALVSPLFERGHMQQGLILGAVMEEPFLDCARPCALARHPMIWINERLARCWGCCMGRQMCCSAAVSTVCFCGADADKYAACLPTFVALVSCGASRLGDMCLPAM